MLNLTRNIVFIKDVFYDNTNAVLKPGTEERGQMIKLKDAAGTEQIAKWEVPTGEYVLSNIDTLMESPLFGDLMDKKMTYMHIFKTLPSKENSDLLSNFMQSVIDAMLQALKYADKLYWVGPNTDRLRSDKTLEYCLLHGVKVAQTALGIDKTVANIKLPEILTKEHIIDDFNTQVKTRKREIGIDLAEAAAKGGKKSSKKHKNN